MTRVWVIGYDHCVGHREDLLAGAKKCLLERGYARTTARDIVAASGANLASIGYHFRSKDALMMTALFEVLEESMVPPAPESGDDPSARWGFEANLAEVIGSFVDHPQYWALSIEVYSQARDNPELQKVFADYFEAMRVDLARQLVGADSVDEPAVRTAGSAYLAMMSGLSLQWMIDPDRAPSARELAAGLRAIADRLEDSAGATGAPNSG